MFCRCLWTFWAWSLLPSVLLADEPAKITIATWNLEWFFDHDTRDNRSDLSKEQSAPSESEWQWKRDAVAAGVSQLRPTILALQEIENRRVLFELCKALRDRHDLRGYRESFVEGNDFATEQDVGLISQAGLVEFGRREQTAAQRDDDQFYGVHKHIVARYEFKHGSETEKLLLLNVHLRAMPEGEAVRQRQARLLRTWIVEAIARGENVVVLGDFNASLPSAKTTPESELGILRGLDTESQADDLVDLHPFLAEADRTTHLHGQEFDRILVSPALIADTPGKADLVFQGIQRAKSACVRGEQADKDHWNVYYKIPQSERDVSDHYPLMATFEWK